MIVCKFGGTSVVNKSSIDNIKNIILENDERRIVVFSAFGKRHKQDIKITDLLIEIIIKTIRGENVNQTMSLIKTRFKEMTDELNTKINIDKIFDKIIKKYLKNKDADFLISRGEYLTTLIISKYLKIKFIDSVKIFNFEKYKPNYEKIEKKLKKYLKNNKIIAIPGFYGLNNNKYFIFERGGSDLTGAIISKAIKSECYENWTDVDGVFSYNPKIIFNQKPIEVISYEEMLTMSSYDATVVQYDCVKELINSSVILKIKNTNNSNNKGSVIANIPNLNKIFVCVQRNNCQALIICNCKNKKNKLIKIFDENKLKYFKEEKHLLCVCDKQNCDDLVRKINLCLTH